MKLLLAIASRAATVWTECCNTELYALPRDCMYFMILASKTSYLPMQH